MKLWMYLLVLQVDTHCPVRPGNSPDVVVNKAPDSAIEPLNSHLYNSKTSTPPLQFHRVFLSCNYTLFFFL